MGADRPGESEAERADRNFVELLQELRVVQTGVQILFAFLLTMPFQSRFEGLGDGERDVYVLAVLLAAGAVLCLTAPVAYHRALFRMRLKDDLVTIAGRFAIAGLAFLGAAIVTSVGLVLDVALGPGASLTFTLVLGAAVLTVWLAMPLWTRREHKKHQGH
ncbi:DUF6328 family protein [Spongisporangium articulatum]|uniref:DUF6328 family protein n=1 Tax=Spongisporangium articulatum TaxID=3362603 RepID=A0ABW8AIG3_9ACTN